MSKFSLFTQIAMIIVAVVITVMYIKPTYANIKATQDTTTLYEDEADKVKDVDMMLEKKLAIVNGVAGADVEALKRFMPDTVDEVEVMKDIQSMFTSLKLPLLSISSGGSPAATVDDVRLIRHQFSITSKMTYAEVKQMLHAIEVNNYLMQIDSLKLQPTEGGLVSVGLSLTTFSRSSALPAASNANTEVIE